MTAQEAKELSIKMYGQLQRQQEIEVLAEIRIQAERGKSILIYSKELFKETTNNLFDLGYSIHESYENIGTIDQYLKTEITW